MSNLRRLPHPSSTDRLDEDHERSLQEIQLRQQQVLFVGICAVTVALTFFTFGLDYIVWKFALTF